MGNMTTGRYAQHPLPGAVFTVITSELVWCAGMLDCIALLRDEGTGAHYLAAQVAGVYGSSPASLYDLEGRWRNCADRFPLSAGAVTGLRFTMDFSVAKIVLPPSWNKIIAAAASPAATAGGGPGADAAP